MKPTVIGACAAARPPEPAVAAPTPAAPSPLITSRRLNPDCVMSLLLWLVNTFLYTSKRYASGKPCLPGVARAKGTTTGAASSGHDRGTCEAACHSTTLGQCAATPVRVYSHGP